MSQRHPKQASQANTGSSNPTTSTKAVVPSAGKNQTGHLVSDVEIRLCAYRKWEAAGKPAGNGVPFWLAAEQELLQGKKEKSLQPDGWRNDPEQQRLEAEKAVKESNGNVDSHYRDNNRMFQGHGERGHRHGGSD